MSEIKEDPTVLKRRSDDNDAAEISEKSASKKIKLDLQEPEKLDVADESKSSEASVAIEEKEAIKPSVVIDKYIILPIATIGCGKTTVAQTLQKLYPYWGHVQNDDLPEGRHKLEKECLKFLSSVSDASKTIRDENNVLFVDRNNHMIKERASFFENMDSLKAEFFGTDPTVEYKFHYIALNFLPNRPNLLQDTNLWDLTLDRIVKRASVLMD